MILTRTLSLRENTHCRSLRDIQSSHLHVPKHHSLSVVKCARAGRCDHSRVNARGLAGRCHAQIGAGVVQRSQRQDAPSSMFQEGICGLPGVTSPALLQSFYTQAVAPRLQRLHAAVQRSSPSVAMAELLDQLWCDLKTILSTSRHIASRHASDEWRRGASEVASRAAKFEAYLLADKDTLEKLHALELRLCKTHKEQTQRLLEATALHSRERVLLSGSAAPTITTSRPSTDTESVSCTEGVTDHKAPMQIATKVAASTAAAAAADTLADQLQLCRLLLHTHSKGGIATGDLDPGNIVRQVAMSQGSEQLQQLSAAERQAVAALQAALSNPSSAPLLDLQAALFQYSSHAIQSGSPSEHTPQDSQDASCSPEPLSNSDGSSSSSSSTERGGSDGGGIGGSSNSSQGAYTATRSVDMIPTTAALLCLTDALQDPILGPMLSKAESAGYPPGLLRLTRATLHALMTRHPNRELRSAAYEVGVQEMRQRAIVGCSGVGSVRAAAADCVGASSFAAHTQDRLSAGGAESIVEMLVQAAEQIRPAADSQVLQLQTLLASVDSDAELAPWDVEYLNQRSLASLMTPNTQAMLSPHLTLQGLLLGVNDLLQHHWGGLSLQLQQVASVEAEEHSSDDIWSDIASGGRNNSKPNMGGSGGGCMSQQGGCWGSQVLKLVLFAEDSCAGCSAAGSTAPHAGRNASSGTSGISRSSSDSSSSSHSGLSAACTDGSVSGPGMRPRGVLFIDPGGGGYGTRQLGFCRDAATLERPVFLPGNEGRYGSKDAHELEEAVRGLPVVSVGLQWGWKEGRAESLSALQELMHELGHALHILLSSSPPHCTCSSHNNTSNSNNSSSNSSNSSNSSSNSSNSSNSHPHNPQPTTDPFPAPLSTPTPPLPLPPAASSALATVATLNPNSHTTPTAPDTSSPTIPATQPHPASPPCPTNVTSETMPNDFSLRRPPQIHHKHFGGLHLPLNILEIPSTLFERIIMDERTLAVILRVATPSGQDEEEEEVDGSKGGSVAGPTAAAVRSLSEYYRASLTSPLALQEQILCALLDQLVNMAPAAAMQRLSDSGSSFQNQDPTMSPSWILDMVEQIWSSYSSLPSFMYGSMKQLAVLPVAAHHQATYHSYISAFLAARAVWDEHLAADPCGRESGAAVRCLLLERGARTAPDRFMMNLLPQRKHA